MKEKQQQNNRLLFIYAGAAFQLLAGLGIALYVGYLVDKKLHFRFPLLIWILPLLVIIGFIIKAVKDTSKK
jgi:hypothetical protein